jgi:electron transfer flavoprotein alpha subunit
MVIRDRAFEMEPSGNAPAVVVSATISDVPGGTTATITNSVREDHRGLALEEATVVVAGGRGMGDIASYALIEEAARLLHGAPGASRAIVDAGWVPYSYQVGQTGKTVKPMVYLACGISGATQHLVGMNGAQNVVAINKDADAPIFGVADLGIVGDVQQILPALIEMIRSRALR